MLRRAATGNENRLPAESAVILERARIIKHRCYNMGIKLQGN